ncbi:hypothetical protein [Streptomyces sp. NPDC001604]|uniref:hypothetical protein n=1 Tax=Streptomyces sp. NPDC001604 TaxID=3364593 RepID=UPI0036CDB5F6
MTTLVTEEQVKQAEQDAERAEQASLAADKLYVKGAGSTQAYEEQQNARRRAEQAKKRLEKTRTDYAEQETLRAARAELMQTATKEMAPVFRKVAKSREEAVSALAAARTAMGKALEAAGTYDVLVREAAGELVNRGLRGEYGEQTGGLLDGSLMVAGERWSSVDAPGVLLVLLGEAVRAAGGRHRLGVVPQAAYVGLAQQRATREFLDRLGVTQG